MNNKSSSHLPACVVSSDKASHVGALYLATDSVLVLLNNINSQADLGPLKSVRNVHIEPEVDILILPKTGSYAVDFLEEIQ